MQNIEYKAELRDRELAEAILLRTGGVRVASLEQSDTYYRIADGRLKRRQCVDEPVEWIYYHRPNSSGPKLSQFTIYTEREALERFGAQPIPVWVIVNKQREMWIHGPLRVHLDRVIGLGEFLEIEALVTPKRPELDCCRAVEKLRAILGPVLGEPISAGYADLLSHEVPV
jgi:adenylate cyclase class IV